QLRRSRVVSIVTVSGLADLERAMPEDTISPERVLAGRRLLSRLEELIAGLPERGRRVIRLRKIEGLTQRENADQLGVSQPIVEEGLSRGLRRVIESMTEAEREAFPIRRPKARKGQRGGRPHG